MQPAMAFGSGDAAILQQADELRRERAEAGADVIREARANGA